jgi:hypothetical protein
MKVQWQVTRGKVHVVSNKELLTLVMELYITFYSRPLISIALWLTYRVLVE